MIDPQSSSPSADTAASTTIPTARDGFDFADLSARMAAAPPGADFIDGDLAGAILAVAGIQRLPQMVRTPIIRTVSAIGKSLWRGKRFHHTSGTNLWLSRRHPRTFGDFSRRTATDRSAALDYNQPRNPRPMRRVTGALVDLGPGMLLGAMYLRLGQRRVTLMYFTLER